MGFPSTAIHQTPTLFYPYGQDSQKFNFGWPHHTDVGYVGYNSHRPMNDTILPPPVPQPQPSSSRWADSLGLSLGCFPTGPVRVSATAGASSLGISGRDVPFHHDFGHASSQIIGSNGTYIPSSPSDVSSILSTDTESSPTPEFVHVVCNAPLVAPVPLPYHSPTFLQFDLPDDDEDLSHPPYVSRPHKRKRGDDDDEDDSHRFVIMRRRAVNERHVRWQRGALQSYGQFPPMGPHPVPAAYFGEAARNR